jgi:hypothetical protein
MRVVTLILLVLSLCGCSVMEGISEKAFANATATGAKTELGRLGYRVTGTIACALPKSNTMAVVRVNCTGRTAGGQPVTVTGIATSANTRNPRQEFVIRVSGREVLRKACLGLGCDKSTAR